MTFDRFPGRLTVDGRLRALTAVRVGAGHAFSPVGTDLPVVRDALGTPYIPGSSLKGPLRAEVERLVRAARPRRACNPTRPAERCITPDRLAALEQTAAEDPAGPDTLTPALIDATCWVCRLFGAPWLASRVQVADLPIDQDTWAGQLQVRDGVAIDRDTETARVGLKYDYEVVPAGAEFLCRVRADTDHPPLLGMLALGLRALETGQIAIGGGRSRGLGRVHLFVERRVLVRRDAASLLEYLAAPDTGGVPVDDATVATWVAAFVDCIRADTLPEPDHD